MRFELLLALGRRAQRDLLLELVLGRDHGGERVLVVAQDRHPRRQLLERRADLEERLDLVAVDRADADAVAGCALDREAVLDEAHDRLRGPASARRRAGRRGRSRPATSPPPASRRRWRRAAGRRPRPAPSSPGRSAPSRHDDGTKHPRLREVGAHRLAVDRRPALRDRVGEHARRTRRGRRSRPSRAPASRRRAARARRRAGVRRRPPRAPRRPGRRRSPRRAGACSRRRRAATRRRRRRSGRSSRADRLRTPARTAARPRARTAPPSAAAPRAACPA